MSRSWWRTQFISVCALTPIGPRIFEQPTQFIAWRWLRSLSDDLVVGTVRRALAVSSRTRGLTRAAVRRDQRKFNCGAEHPRLLPGATSQGSAHAEARPAWAKICRLTRWPNWSRRDASLDAMFDAFSGPPMRTTVTLDDELLSQARAYTGIQENSALIQQALKTLVQREAARRLALLGGSAPGLARVPRRQTKVLDDPR